MTPPQEDTVSATRKRLIAAAAIALVLAAAALIGSDSARPAHHRCIAMCPYNPAGRQTCCSPSH
jgi:hypothetical protein